MKTCRLTAGYWVLGLAFCLGMTQESLAQNNGMYMLQHGIYTPPGAIGSRQAMRGGPVRCFFQPVEIKTPLGSSISLVEKGRFDQPVEAPRKAGLVLGQVYRLKITGIPYNEGREVFPTIELIDRLHPPKGQEVRFAIPLEITQEDLELALDGKYVTRVIYLEDPNNALPYNAKEVGDEWYDVLPSEDPLEIADRQGRPMAILRMGGRLPEDATGLDQSFLGACPPIWNIPSDPSDAPVQVTDAVEPSSRGVAKQGREKDVFAELNPADSASDDFEKKKTPIHEVSDAHASDDGAISADADAASEDDECEVEPPAPPTARKTSSRNGK